jgi:hypothetical protein
MTRMQLTGKETIAILLLHNAVCYIFHIIQYRNSQMLKETGHKMEAVLHKQRATKYSPFSTLGTGDADLRFYITTVQDG